jgi:hypothetical protein
VPKPKDRRHAVIDASACGFRVKELRRKRRFAAQGIIPVTGWTTRTLDEKIVPASEHARLTKRENRPTTRKADTLPVREAHQDGQRMKENRDAV